jgi:hypothetical protein
MEYWFYIFARPANGVEHAAESSVFQPAAA